MSIRPHRIASGFTLVELLLTLAILGVLVGLAAPSFGSAMRDVRRGATADALVGTLQLARSEAIKRAARVSVCAKAGARGGCGADWHAGWIAFVDDGATPGTLDAGETVLRDAPARHPSIAIDALARIDGGSATAPAALIRFGPRGTNHWRGGGTFRVCVRGDPASEGVNVTLGGSARRARRDAAGDVLDAFGGVLDCPAGVLS